MSMRQLNNLSNVYLEAVYGKSPEQVEAERRKKDDLAGAPLIVTNADKKANTKAYQNLKKGVKGYKAADHMKEGDYHSGQGEKIQKRTKKWMDKKGQKGAPGLDAMKARTAEHEAKRGVREEKKADKDYDGDGKVESGKDEYFGSKDKAIKKAMGKKVKEEYDELDEAERKLADRLARKRKVYDKTTKKAMQYARDEGEAAGHARYRMSSISREMDGIKAKMNKEGRISNWRKDLSDLIEVVDNVDSDKEDAVYGSEKQVTEKKGIKNTVKINPNVKIEQAIAEIGGTVLSEKEVGESYEATKTKEVMSALKKRDLKNDVKKKIAADIVKRKGDTGKSDDRYAYEGYQRDPEQSKKDRTHSKQPDPSKGGFTGIGNMSIKDIMKMNAKIKAKEAAKKGVKEEVGGEKKKLIDPKQIRANQIKKQVLLKKMQAVRAGAGADIVASHTPQGEMIEHHTKDKDGNVIEHEDTTPSSVEEASMPNVASKDKKVINSRAKGLFKKDLKGTVQGVNEGKKKGLDGKACWKGYRLSGTKKKGGKTVDNCVKEEDKAFEYVKKQIAAKYGKSGYVSKDNPRKPQSAADKAKARAHQAKVDAENAAERKKDPSQGRYPKG